MKQFLATFLLLLAGCAHLLPGSDPLVVRVEQTELISKTTFDTLEKLDNANRDFWRTNAPDFHHFCEYLRVKVVVNETNFLPRGLAFIAALDATKLAYKNGRASSNALVTALSVLESAASQAQNELAQQQPITK